MLTYLQYGKLVHLLSRTGWDHILQYPELFVHLGPPASFNQAVRRLSGNLSSRDTRGAWLFPF
jgi:hypothetical protein